MNLDSFYELHTTDANEKSEIYINKNSIACFYAIDTGGTNICLTSGAAIQVTEDIERIKRMIWESE